MGLIRHINDGQLNTRNHFDVLSLVIIIWTLELASETRQFHKSNTRNVLHLTQYAKDSAKIKSRQLRKKDVSKLFRCVSEHGKEHKFVGKRASRRLMDSNVPNGNKTNNYDLNRIPQERPWVVFIRSKAAMSRLTNISSASKQYTCGGILINQRLILTAAHCCCDSTHCKASK